MQIACAILSFVASLVLLHFSTLFHKQHGFWEGGGTIQHKVCVLIVSTCLSKKISHSRKK